jgi:AraC-like DNA-binding protein
VAGGSPPSLYVERRPPAELARTVRTLWIQRTGAEPYVQRHLPTGGIEIQFPLSGAPRLLGPLTGPRLEVLPPHATVVGARFWPGAAPALPLAVSELVDQSVDLVDLWGASVDRTATAMASASSDDLALTVLQTHLLTERRRSVGADPLMGEAVGRLMPWHRVDVAALAGQLALSESSLRRRCLRSVGVGPKALQRILRFQGFVALAQAGTTASGRAGRRVAGLAMDVGYADQAHLSRECVRLSGLTPRQLVDGSVDRCACEHNHAASYAPFLATRRSAPPEL